MLSLVFSGALCYANGVAETEEEKGKGIPLEVKEKVIHGSSDNCLLAMATNKQKRRIEI